MCLDYNSTPKKQYEAIRAFVVDNLSAEEAAIKYGYKLSTIYSMIRDVKTARHFFY